MRKIQILGIALVAMFAFSAIVASMASAETTLLAEWLVSGAAVTATLTTTSTGTVLVEDAQAKIGIECGGELVGTVGPNGEGSTTAVLAPGGGNAITLGNLLKCTPFKGCEASATDVLVAPEGLPWQGLLQLDEGTGATFLGDAIAGGSFFTECLVIGIKVSETCNNPSTQSGEVLNVTGGIEAMGNVSPNVNCTVGGNGAGEITFLAGNLTKVTGGGTLEASE
jgi:hypothetical protein